MHRFGDDPAGDHSLSAEFTSGLYGGALVTATTWAATEFLVMSTDEQELSVHDLFREIALAKARMSVNNPHRLIFAKCEAALWHLSKELHDLKQPLGVPISTTALRDHVCDVVEDEAVTSDIEEGTPV
jgi:hypothetical protein